MQYPTHNYVILIMYNQSNAIICLKNKIILNVPKAPDNFKNRTSFFFFSTLYCSNNDKPPKAKFDLTSHILYRTIKCVAYRHACDDILTQKIKIKNEKK